MYAYIYVEYIISLYEDTSIEQALQKVQKLILYAGSTEVWLRMGQGASPQASLHTQSIPSKDRPSSLHSNTWSACVPKLCY